MDRGHKLQWMALPQLLHLPEHTRPDRPRLGRHIHRDPASLNFMVERETIARPSRSVTWDRSLPVVDQGRLGCCTAAATVGTLGTEPFWTATGATALPADPAALQQWMLDLYTAETRIDGFAGVWPPDDTGSTGLAACKVLKARGVVAGYRWARTSPGLARLLQDGPVMMGTAWFEAFFDPDRDGFIDRGDWSGSEIVGGHEFELIGIDVRDPLQESVVEAVNSWGPDWGDGGRFRFRLGTYMALRAYTDLKQPVV